MDISSLDSILNDSGMETDCINQWDLGNFDLDLTRDGAWDQFIEELPPSENSSLESTEILPENNNIEQYFVDQSNTEEPANENSGMKWSSLHKNIPSILSFGDPDSPIETQTVERVSKKVKTSRSRPDWANREHVLAERKRREKISENLYTLSTILPGLKKRDKATVLTKTIEYMKQMQEKMKTLEDEVAKERTETEARSTNKKAKLVSVSSAGENNQKIEIKDFENTFLIKIHIFQASKGTLVKVLNLIESLHLRVVTLNSVQFSEQILDLTIISQVEDGFVVTMTDIFQKLKSISENSQ